jgi:putative transposase
MQKSYPTDLNDDQWQLIEALLPAPKTLGRPPVNRRMVINALLYITRAGGAWRLLPKEFGPWQTVYGYFSRWNKTGIWSLINEALRTLVRKQEGKRGQPTAAILDSQTVRSANHGGERGFDGAKLTKGRKRHILVDTLGLLLWVCVSPADVSERAGTRSFLAAALNWFKWLRRIWADQGYAGEDFEQWVHSHRKTGSLRLEIVSKKKRQRGFSVLPKRWIVERTFGWLVLNRRLVRDYETKTENGEAFVLLSMIALMLRRLA